ncbi:MAG: hypothetical protein WD077_06205 [Bacteroidia bacterium]
MPKVFYLSGSLIMKADINDMQEYQVDLSNLGVPGGIYLVSVQTDEASFYQKIIYNRR